MRTIPCAECKTTGGYCEPNQERPRRRKGRPFGIAGMLCQRCYFRHYQRSKFVPKAAKPPEGERPFVVDPADHHKLVWEVALWFRNKPFARHNTRAIDLDDLVQQGQIGLLKACRNFDPALKIKFSSFAVPVIRSAILRMLGSKVHLVRIPEYLHKDLRSGVTESRSPKHTACLAAAREVRAREFVGEGSLGEPLAGLAFARPDDDAERAEQAKQAAALLASLPEREARILRLRFGFDVADQTRSQIGKTLGVTGERVRQIEVAALKQLRGQVGVAS